MPLCPKCSGEIAMMAIKCVHCGYDFPEQPDDKSQRGKSGWEHSSFSDFSLIVGGIASLMMSLWLFAQSIGVIINIGFLSGITVILQAIVFYALFVVFFRLK
jgi:hypothetical protein